MLLHELVEALAEVGIEVEGECLLRLVAGKAVARELLDELTLQVVARQDHAGHVLLLDLLDEVVVAEGVAGLSRVAGEDCRERHRCED